jgi:putative transposase
MPVIRSNHCAYDIHYHLVFVVKYRKALLYAKAKETLHQTFREIELRYELSIEQVGDDGDHVHILISFHPKYSIAEVARKLKSITARELFIKLPELKKQLWGGEFWSDGYYVSTVGTGGNKAVARALHQEPRQE